MRDAVIVEAVRTPLGRRNGSLKDWHPAELLGETLRELFNRSGVDPALVEDNVTGCVTQIGEQSANIGRNAWLAAGLPEQVPSTTVDRQCGSSQQAAHFAAQAVISGAHDVVVASGVEVMSRIPMAAAIDAGGLGVPFPPAMLARYNIVPQGLASEMIATRWGITRHEADELSARSQTLAGEARAAGRFQREIHPLKVTSENGVTNLFDADEGIRPSTVESLGALKPAFYTDELASAHPSFPWVTTAGNSSQISDGAAALLIMTSEKAKQLGVKPRARFHTFALAGDDPVMLLTAPIPATKKALAKSGLTLADIDAVEINEAFATVVLAWKKELGIDDDFFNARVNPNGGAIAIGHPLGGSGARLMTTLLHELEDCGGRFGLQTMCEGGGMANATILERLS